jgi:trimeric autotransporter adhesin
MKRSFTSLKIFLGVLVAVLAFGYNTANASTVTLNITAPGVTTIGIGTTFTITATGTTTYFLGMANAKFYSYTGTLINTDASSSPYNSSVITAPTVPGTYIYKVIATDNNGATATKTITMTVIVPAPTASVVAPATCGGGSTTFTAGTVTPTGGTYNWYLNSSGSTAGGAPTFTSTAKTYTVTLYSTTTYYVSYTTTTGYESAVTPVTATIKDLPFVAQTTAAGLSYAYPFTGNANDASGSGNNGTVVGATLTTDRFGNANSAYSFGSGSEIYTSALIAAPGPRGFTINIWFNTTTASGRLIGYGDGLAGATSGAFDRIIYMNTSGQVVFGIYNGGTETINTTGTYNDGTWHMATATSSAAGTKLYIDGVLQASDITASLPQNFAGYWRIGQDALGGWPGAGNNYFTGSLDDIAIFNRELTANEVYSLQGAQVTSGAVCAGSPLTFTALTQTAASYVWSGPNGFSTTSSTSPTAVLSSPTAAANGTYTVTATGTDGCTSTASVNATVYAATPATFTIPSSTYVNAATTITLTTAIPTGYTYTFSLGNGSATALSGTTCQATWPTPGVKPVILTITNTSDGCVTSYSTTITVTQNVTAANYAFSQPITLNTSAMGISTTLSNFPALIYIKENALIASGGLLPNCATNVQNPVGGTSGYDFAFTLNGNTNELFYQVESYDPTTGTLLVWVQLPTVTSTNPSLTFYFGSSNPNHPASFTQATWTDDYQAVYHFNEPLAGAVVLDATANGKNAGQINTVQGTGEIHSAAGITGGGYVFDGATAEIISAAGANLTGSFTLSGWVNMTSPIGHNDQKVISNEFSSGNGGYKLSLYGSSTGNMKNEVETRDALGNTTLDRASPGGTVLSGGNWYYVQGVYDNSSNTFYSYVNGALDRSLNPAAPAATGGDIYMGTDYNSLNWFNGIMNEIRISSAVKSPDWIKAEYYNQKNPTLFTACGSIITGVLANSQPIGGAIVYTWKGGGTTDPTLASNWISSASGAPNVAPVFDGTCSLNISGGATPYPVLINSISVYGLTMGAGATITLGDYTLSVGCHIYNNSAGTGTITSTSLGGVNFNGLLAAQNYYCSSTNTNTIANLTLNNSTAGTLHITGSGNVSVSNQLTDTKGYIVVDPSGTLLLTSTASGSATVNPITLPYTISGNVSVQRYITGGTAGYRGYRMLTSPVNINGLTSQTSSAGYIALDYLNTGMLTGGPGGGFDVVTTNPLTYFYNEARTANHLAYIAGKNVGVYSISGSGGSPAYSITTYNTTLGGAKNTNVLVPVGNSYQIYFVGNTSNTVSSTIPNAATVTAVGYLNQGIIPVNFFNGATSSLFMSYTLGTGAPAPGFNQVGNPYASTISLDKVYADNSVAITPVFWELKEPGNTFVGYNGLTHTASTTGSGAGAYIVSGQGFFVVANGTGQSLTFNEGEKVTNQLTTASTPPLLLDQRLRNTNSIAAAETLPSGLAGLHLQITQDTATYTQTGIYFDKTWSDKFSPKEDAVDLDGTAPKVFLSSYSADGARLCINQLGDYSKGKTVKLYASATTSGAFTISLADIQNIDPLYNVYLRDHKLNDSVDLRTANSYNFNIAIGDTTTYGGDRFDLVIEQRALPPYQLLSFAGQKVNTGVQLNWIAKNAGSYTGFTLEKQIGNNNFTPLYTIQSDSSTTYSFVDKNPIVGSNVYRLEQNDINGNITYSSLVTIGYNNVSSNGYFSVYPNPSKDVINILVNSTGAISPNYTADIYNTSGVLVDHRVLNTFTWTEDISSYKEGVYIIALKNANGDVMAKSKFIKTK